MGSGSESMIGKVKDKIGSVVGGNPKKVSLADEDPDIEYPEPLDLVQTDDGMLVMSREIVEAEKERQGEQADSADAAPGADTEDTTDAGSPTD